MNEFNDVFNHNLKRKGKKRFLHVIGTLAFRDRNGTVDLLNAMKYSKGDYELVITSQHELPERYLISDPRVKFQIGNKPKASELYKDFDAMILPRRYGGLSLVVNEALSCGLPVIMTDVSPNNELLPSSWLVPAEIKTVVHAREIIDVYGVEPETLGKAIDELVGRDLSMEKTMAYTIGMQFSTDVLKPEYEKLWT
jgi:glycosyltransferase involved in cell wall biosynthesis